MADFKGFILAETGLPLKSDWSLKEMETLNNNWKLAGFAIHPFSNDTIAFLFRTDKDGVIEYDHIYANWANADTFKETITKQYEFQRRI